MNPTACQSCGSSARIALVDGKWICAKCAPPVTCCKCGEPAKAIGVERFAVGIASDNAAYDLDQAMVYWCEARNPRHFTYGEGHKGPGTRNPPQVYDAPCVTVDGVPLTENEWHDIAIEGEADVSDFVGMKPVTLAARWQVSQDGGNTWVDCKVGK